MDLTINNKYKVFQERHKIYVTETVCDSFKELKEFEQKVFKVKFYFLAKKQGHRHPINDLEYPKGLVLKL